MDVEALIPVFIWEITSFLRNINSLIILSSSLLEVWILLNNSSSKAIHLLIKARVISLFHSKLLIVKKPPLLLNLIIQMQF